MSKTRMTQRQMDYAISRLEEVFETRTALLRKKHLTREARTLSPQETITALRAGKWDVDERSLDNLQRGYERHRSPYYTHGAQIFSCITFAEECDAEYDEEAYTKAKVALDAEYQHALDSLMLGECADALKLIEDMEAVAAGEAE